VIAGRHANRHHFPKFQKTVVFPNEAKRNEESQRAKQILKKPLVIPNESITRRGNKVS
jgi:hypothetical protein